MPSINQQTLATALNLSQTTVSRALSNHPSINAETKAQVWSLAAELGYQLTSPKRSVSGARGGRNVVVGVMIAIPKHSRGHTETSQLVLKGIAERSSNENVTLDVIYHEPSDDNPKTIQRRLRQRNWQGCILIHPMAHEVVERISKTLPCVSVVENYRRDFIDSIDVDQTDSIVQIVRLLHQRGHSRIGFLTFTYEVPTPWVHHRFGAYVDVLFQLGLDFDPHDTINVRRGEAFQVGQVVDRMCARIACGTTAFVCAADHQAYLVWHELQRRGIRVPDDVSLTGFDGIPPPEALGQLATVCVPYDEIGRSAFHQVLHRITFPSAPRRHVMVDGDVIEGRSIRDLVSETRPALVTA
jgi:LacI family transcriptional regulator